jgi:hypothetical protein
LLSLGFMLLLGPINFFVLRMRKKIIWFYLTTPFLALAAMVLLGFYSAFSEGFGLNFNENALLLHDQLTNEGAVYQGRGYFTGMASSRGLRYSVNSAVVPMGPEQGSHKLAADWSSGQHLTDGWVQSRTVAGLYSITPVEVRMGLRAEWRGHATLMLSNDLPYAVKRAYVRLIDHDEHTERIFFAANIAPGNSAAMQHVGSSDSNYPSEGFARTFGSSWPVDDSNFTIFAETAMLPYLENGGLTGQLKTGHFFYLAIRSILEGQ